MLNHSSAFSAERGAATSPNMKVTGESKQTHYFSKASSEEREGRKLVMNTSIRSKEKLPSRNSPMEIHTQIKFQNASKGRAQYSDVMSMKRPSGVESKVFAAAEDAVLTGSPRRLV